MAKKSRKSSSCATDPRSNAAAEIATKMRRGAGGADHASDVRIRATPSTLIVVEVEIRRRIESSKPPMVMSLRPGSGSVGHAARTVVITASQVSEWRRGWPSRPVAPAASQAAISPVAAANKYRAATASPTADSAAEAGIAAAVWIFGGLALT